MQFSWKQPQIKAFQLLKESLLKMKQLSHFREDNPTSFVADASSHGIGAVLSQMYLDGLEYQIAFASKTLTDT